MSRRQISVDLTTQSQSPNSSLGSRLAAVFGVQEGEGQTLTLMALLYFVISIAYVFVQTTAFGLFVNEYGSQSLPFAYMSVAVLASLVAFLYLKASDRLAFQTAQYVNMAFLVGICLAFWIGLRSSLQHWVVFLLPFWFQALTNQANLVVWHLAGHLFDVRQAKRLFGLIGAGNWLANIIGGAVVAAILALTGTANAYLLAALALVVAVPVLFAAMRRPQTAAAPQPSPTRNEAPAGFSPFRHRYSRLILANTLLWWLGFSFIDNIFYDRAGLEFQSGAALAAFIARQLSVMGVIAIITTLFLTSRVIGRYGLRAGLMAMPVVVTASILLLAIGGPLGWSAAALFWIATVAKTLNVALGFSISLVAGSLLFQPLFGRQRAATQTVSEGIVQPVAMGLGGVLLLIFNTLLHFNAVGLSYLFLVIAAFWFVIMARLAKEYPLVMSEALLKRSLGETTTLTFDPSAVAQLRASLRSPRPGLAIYALNQLEQLAPQSWAETFEAELPALLEHPAPEVRAEAARRVLALRLLPAARALRGRLAVEQAPAVRAALVEGLAAMGDRQSAPLVLEALRSPEWIFKRGAMLGLLGSDSTEDAMMAEGAIEEMVSSRSPGDRAMAAEILGEMPPSRSGQMLVKLLSDKDVRVRRAALRSAGRVGNDGLIPAILSACDSPDTAPVAEQVLIGKGERALGTISSELLASRAGAIPRGRLQAIIRTLGRLPGPRSLELLEPRISSPDPQLRLLVLRSLGAIGFRSHSVASILAQVRNEVTLAGRLSADLDTVRRANDPGRLGILEGALTIAFRQARQRTLLLLSFIFHAEAIQRARAALEAAGGGLSAVALETVDALLPSSTKPLVLPMIEDIPAGERVKRWQAAGVEILPGELKAVLLALIGTSGDSAYEPWTRMCAMHAAAGLGEQSCKPALERLRDDADLGIRAMSRWSLGRLSADQGAEGDGNMLSLVEKVLILKSSPLFGDTPDNVLADIADLVDEIAVEKGQVVFNRGDAGDSLYIIVSGRVEVWENERQLNELREGDVFGELALLDPEPRLATVKASESTRLLRLDQTQFHEVLAVRPEVSSGIIRVVTRYLRGQLQYAREVNEKLRSLESIAALSNPSRN